MLIKDFTLEPFTINGIKFNYHLGANLDDFSDMSIDKPLSYDDDVFYSFNERVEKAKEELAHYVCDLSSLDEAKSFFKSNTECGNIHYWGDFLYVYTANMDSDEILFGIRVD